MGFLFCAERERVAHSGDHGQLQWGENQSGRTEEVGEPSITVPLLSLPSTPALLSPCQGQGPLGTVWPKCVPVPAYLLH